MQDMHADGSGGGGGGRFFGGGDRRLRCPRCESLNTKFCYYNNYNLSQPRHFCKSCRRYWTKGGCRKTKRSKPKSSGSFDGDAPRESKSNAQSSSSESSSLTAAAMETTPTSANTAAVEEGSAPSNTTLNSALVYNFPDARFFNVNPQANPNFDHQPFVNHPSTDGQIFSTEIGSFTSLMTSSEEMMGFGMRDIPTTSCGRAEQVNQAPVAENRARRWWGARRNEGLAAALDWANGGSGGDQGLFDLTAGVDPAYWSQSPWNDNDQSLNYLP
ncbi:hypothetical protein Pfo_028059 [Paulownia fortunei]|nr:hypothetical protein Pfo_028059 [Paulownia fortunei]